MITAEFYLREDRFWGFSIRGHAGYAAYGQDIVCASVSSAVEMVANGITEILKVPAQVGVFENEVKLLLPEGDFPEAVNFLRSLRLHLEVLQQDFPRKLRITDTEVQ